MSYGCLNSFHIKYKVADNMSSYRFNYITIYKFSSETYSKRIYSSYITQRLTVAI